MKKNILKVLLSIILVFFLSTVVVSCKFDKHNDENNTTNNITSYIKQLDIVINKLENIKLSSDSQLYNEKTDFITELKTLKLSTEENIINETNNILKKLNIFIEKVEKEKQNNKDNIKPTPNPEQPGNNDNPSNDPNIDVDNPDDNPNPIDDTNGSNEDDTKEPDKIDNPYPDNNSNSDTVNDPSPKEGTDEDKYYKERQLFKPSQDLKNDKLVKDSYIYNPHTIQIREYARGLKLNPNTKTFDGFNNYYQKMNNVSLNDYLETLSNIINTKVKYGGYANGSASTFKKADVIIKDGKKYYYRMYDSILESINSGAAFDREHVWPNSRLGVDRISGEKKGVASDYYNLRYCLPSLNRGKKDRYFKDSNSEAPHTVGKDGFYPGKSQKGDVARILLYMAVKYPHLKLVINPDAGRNGSYNVETAQIGDVRLLLKWHLEDPVDQFERDRNEAILKIQGNRNPFVDHPDIFEKVLKIKLLSQKLTSKKNKEPDYKEKKIQAVFIKDIIFRKIYYL